MIRFWIMLLRFRQYQFSLRRWIEICASPSSYGGNQLTIYRFYALIVSATCIFSRMMSALDLGRFGRLFFHSNIPFFFAGKMAHCETLWMIYIPANYIVSFTADPIITLNRLHMSIQHKDICRKILVMVRRRLEVLVNHPSPCSPNYSLRSFATRCATNYNSLFLFTTTQTLNPSPLSPVVTNNSLFFHQPTTLRKSQPVIFFYLFFFWTKNDSARCICYVFFCFVDLYF